MRDEILPALVRSLMLSTTLVVPLLWASVSLSQTSPPEVLFGKWESYQTAWMGSGPLTVTPGSISWTGCKVHYSLIREEFLDDYPGDVLKQKLPPDPDLAWRVITLKIIRDGRTQSWCFKHQDYIQFAISPNSDAMADIVFYGSPEEFKAGHFGWGRFRNTERDY